MPLRVLYFVTTVLFVIVAITYFYLRYRNRQPVLSDPQTDVAIWQRLSQTQAVSSEAIRGPITLLLMISLLLIWLSQILYRRVPPHQTKWLVVLIGIGASLFIFAGQTAVRQHLFSFVVEIGHKVCRYFQIEKWQLVLFLTAPLFVMITILAAGDKLLAIHALSANFAWLLVIGFVIVGAYRKEAATQLSRWEIWLLAFLFVLALAARGLLTAEFPATFSGDEGSAGLVAVQFYEGKIDNWFVTGWFSFPSFYFAIQSIGIHLWGQTVQAARLISVFVGGLAVIATYWMTRKMFDRVTAVFAASYLAVSHYHIHFSRIALNNVWDSFFGAVAIFGFWDGWQNGRRMSYVWCGVSLGIGMYFYVSIRVLPLIFLIWAIVAFIRHRQQFIQRFPDMLIAALSATLIALPLGVHFYKFPDQFSAPLNRVTIFGPWLEAEMARTGFTQFEIIAKQMWLGVLGYTYQPLRLFYEPGVPLLLTGAATLFLIGIVWGILNFDLRYLLLTLPMLATVISNGLSQSPPASQRFILATPMVAVFVAIPLGFMASRFETFWPQRKWIAYLLTGLIMVGISYQDIEFYFFQAPEKYIFGGVNTLIATEVADYLEASSEEERVYFFGFPRMGYFSLSTIPYLVPDVVAVDVVQPLDEAPIWDLPEVTHFMFLPERLNDLRFVEMAYPDGEYIQIFDDDEEVLLFVIYKVES